ncbi:MOSC domain-containing protein YiiM [Octadecabacter temperatus]|uniref:6-N-hydroxylaminopurine resistance protein n=1 Tax=Octadecabacter temperatus TaxID=1458307 RepID=A0A0K0Y192_9RHOB|nr:MOSC domain-containing protein [Octadecabacter temperatus]AKS44700.1 6-N-hydroxylaminopurine resistance protein [Octadecabacter temperatus]SIO36306.1 MOSC domain-containing protein YiiM [Octadecabacter temperatus]
MQLVSVNIATPEPIVAKSGQSGIFKRPVAQADVGPLGLEGDAIVDVKHHGGPDQAVYAYTRADYDWWEAVLGREIPAGTFGENLTLDRWPAEVICVGDRLRIGDVVLEVTSPRIPCVTIEARMGIKGFAKQFLEARRPGPYLRVVHGGTIKTGQTIDVEPFKGARKRLADWPGLFGPRLSNKAEVESWLSAPVHHKMRADLEASLGQTP